MTDDSTAFRQLFWRRAFTGSLASMIVGVLVGIHQGSVLLGLAVYATLLVFIVAVIVRVMLAYSEELPDE